MLMDSYSIRSDHNSALILPCIPQDFPGFSLQYTSSGTRRHPTAYLVAVGLWTWSIAGSMTPEQDIRQQSRVNSHGFPVATAALSCSCLGFFETHDWVTFPHSYSHLTASTSSLQSYDDDTRPEAVPPPRLGFGHGLDEGPDNLGRHSRLLPAATALSCPHFREVTISEWLGACGCEDKGDGQLPNILTTATTTKANQPKRRRPPHEPRPSALQHHDKPVCWHSPSRSGAFLLLSSPATSKSLPRPGEQDIWNIRFEGVRRVSSDGFSRRGFRNHSALLFQILGRYVAKRTFDDLPNASTLPASAAPKTRTTPTKLG
ncbi:hypothetical protein BKA70DRAFT_1569853 [Coprinopsis sp. MPI-PUGE-AT-0042]|nr:hypothetical protein BKA70DRAFT_1569853 [Coprinopsis sp. MPI-PUGE-AT-0042]